MLQELYYCLERKIVTCLPHKAAHSCVHGGRKVWGERKLGGRGEEGREGGGRMGKRGRGRHNVMYSCTIKVSGVMYTTAIGASKLDINSITLRWCINRYYYYYNNIFGKRKGNRNC